jgi:hypothetical protein
MDDLRDYTKGTNRRSQERLYWSIHEAGHAVMACLSGYSIHYATVLPSEDYPDGAIHYHNKGELPPDDATDKEVREALQRLMRVDVAGAVAEYLAYRDEPTVGPLPYWDEVIEGGRLNTALMVEPFKVNPGLLDTVRKLPKALKREFGPDRIMPPTIDTLTEHWPAVMEIAARLRDKGLVSGGEIASLVHGIERLRERYPQFPS